MSLRYTACSCTGLAVKVVECQLIITRLCRDGMTLTPIKLSVLAIDMLRLMAQADIANTFISKQPMIDHDDRAEFSEALARRRSTENYSVTSMGLIVLLKGRSANCPSRGRQPSPGSPIYAGYWAGQHECRLLTMHVVVKELSLVRHTQLKPCDAFREQMWRSSPQTR